MGSNTSLLIFLIFIAIFFESGFGSFNSTGAKFKAFAKPNITHGDLANALDKTINGFNDLSKNKNESAILPFLAASKDLVKPFMGAYGPVLDTIWKLISIGNTPMKDELLNAIVKLEKRMDQRFDEMTDRIDQLEKDLMAFLLENTYFRDVSMHIGDYHTDFRYMMETMGKNMTRFNATMHDFVETCNEYKPRRILENINMMVNEKCVKPWEPREKQLMKLKALMAAGNDDDCLISAVFDKFNHERRPLLDSIDSIRLDMTSLLPMAMACYKFDPTFDQVRRDESTDRFLGLFDQIFDSMRKWTEYSLKNSWPADFEDHANKILKKEYDNLPKDNDAIGENFNSLLTNLANTIRKDIVKLGLPGRDYHVHVFSTYVYERGFGPVELLCDFLKPHFAIIEKTTKDPHERPSLTFSYDKLQVTIVQTSLLESKDAIYALKNLQASIPSTKIWDGYCIVLNYCCYKIQDLVDYYPWIKAIVIVNAKSPTNCFCDSIFTAQCSSPNTLPSYGLASPSETNNCYATSQIFQETVKWDEAHWVIFKKHYQDQAITTIFY